MGNRCREENGGEGRGARKARERAREKKKQNEKYSLRERGAGKAG